MRHPTAKNASHFIHRCKFLLLFNKQVMAEQCILDRNLNYLKNIKICFVLVLDDLNIRA